MEEEIPIRRNLSENYFVHVAESSEVVSDSGQSYLYYARTKNGVAGKENELGSR